MRRLLLTLAVATAIFVGGSLVPEGTGFGGFSNPPPDFNPIRLAIAPDLPA
jgi:hypothetical protein